MTELEQKIYEVVRKIPEGKVATYGQIAVLCGNKKLSRVVGNTMHKNPYPFYKLAKECGYTVSPAQIPENFLPVPCHRVVNSKGCMGKNFGLGGPHIQAKMLEKEGIKITNLQVNLNKFAIQL